jgi:hypothetical protein
MNGEEANFYHRSICGALPAPPPDPPTANCDDLRANCTKPDAVEAPCVDRIARLLAAAAADWARSRNAKTLRRHLLAVLEALDE